MDKLVGVLAGTPIDTQMGVDFLLKKGISAKGYPVSRNAKEQSDEQNFSKEELYRKVETIVKGAIDDGVWRIFVYCNSLSAAVDIEGMSKSIGIKMITPFVAYGDYGKDYSSLFVMAANAQSCLKIENILQSANKDLNIWSLSSLPLVEAIETNKKPVEIYENLGIEYILKWVEANNIEGIVMGCTHFPYIYNVLQENTSIAVLDPAEKMLQILLQG